MGAREEILARLEKQAREESQPPSPWQSRRRYDDLAGQFAQALTAAKGEVQLARDLDEALSHIDEILLEIGAQSAVADAHQIIQKIDPPTRWPDVGWRLVGNSREDFREFAASAGIGLSVAEAALAETGTVVVSSSTNISRLTSLLPPVHLALVPTSCLTTDIFTWTADLEGPMPSSLTLISGPSKTADIEQTMATGVHGPGRFIAILFS